jgi:MFS family permease
VSRRGLATVVFVQFVALVAVCLVIGDNGWDDGAITLAFARTFAQHSLVALTSHSETVEGFSTVSWFLLNALVALARPSFHSAILASQILSVLCICASTVLLARTCALLGLDKLFSYLTVIAFAAWGCSFGEAGNGMEMGLLAAAFLIMMNELLSPQPRLLLLGTGVVLAVTTRFEALAYVGPLTLGVLLVRQRRAFWVISLTTVVVVLVLTSWRLAVFSDVVPNTYWAKQWPPYAEFDPVSRLVGAVESLSFFVVPLVVLEILLRSGFDLAGLVRARRQAFLLLAAPVLGAVVVGGLVGKHWGYEGRMPYFAFPLLLLLFSLTFSPWVNARRTKLRIAVAVGACLGSLGMSLQGFPSGEMYAALHGGSFGVSPHSYAETARVFRRFARAADLQRPTVLTPDVGGLALCCDDFRVVGLDLLSNRLLAHRGPTALADVLASESPEIVEAHKQWASSGKLYELPYFRAHYLPAFAGGTKLWIRRDVALAIESKGRGCRLPADTDALQEALGKHRYADHDTPDDRRAFVRPGVVFALNQADAAMANLCRWPSP